MRYRQLLVHTASSIAFVMLVAFWGLLIRNVLDDPFVLIGIELRAGLRTGGTFALQRSGRDASPAKVTS